MAKLNLSQAAKVVGRNRTTLWRHINSGKLSSERDRDGNPWVDTSELMRVYGELKTVATQNSKIKQHNETLTNSELIAVIELLRVEQQAMKEQIANLAYRLEHKPKDLDSVTNSRLIKAEDDPLWPREVRTMSDITLRNDLKKKYSDR
jgi:hypothetical protein